MNDNGTNSYHSATSLDLGNYILTPKRAWVSPSLILEGAWPMVLDPNACEFIPNGSIFLTEGNPGNNSGKLSPHARAFIPSKSFQNIKLSNQKKHLDPTTYLERESHNIYSHSNRDYKILNDSQTRNDILSSTSAQSSPAVSDPLIYNQEGESYPSLI